MERQKLQLVNEIVHFGVQRERMGRLRKQKASIKAIRNQTLTVIDKRLTRTPNIKADMLENVYEITCASTLLHGVEIWGVGVGGK
jgi:hypothetical protein